MKDTEFEVFNVFCLSTGHIPEYEAEYMTAGAEIEGLMFDVTEHGFIVYICDESEDDNLPSWITPIIHTARKLECRWVNFDSDAPSYKEFVSYEW